MPEPMVAPALPSCCSLLVGGTVQDAFDIGTKAVKSSPHIPNPGQEGDKFLLLPPAGTITSSSSSSGGGGGGRKVDHTVALFARPNSYPSPAALGLRVEEDAWLQLPPPPDDFLGRSIELFALVQAAASHRLLQVHPSASHCPLSIVYCLLLSMVPSLLCSHFMLARLGICR